ncbi:MAG: hypothetical protein HQL87_14460, partial [Magnetococcales bacterium]|nr:hypothetical protein [Magnetococcales bacterium]
MLHTFIKIKTIKTRSKKFFIDLLSIHLLASIETYGLCNQAGLHFLADEKPSWQVALHHVCGVCSTACPFFTSYDQPLRMNQEIKMNHFNKNLPHGVSYDCTIKLPDDENTGDNLITALAWSPDGRHVVAASYSGETFIFAASEAGFSEKKTIKIAQDNVENIAFSCDSRWIFMPSIDRTLYYCSVSEESKPEELDIGCSFEMWDISSSKSRPLFCVVDWGVQKRPPRSKFIAQDLGLVSRYLTAPHSIFWDIDRIFSIVP